MNRESKPIDNVTVTLLDVALRMVGIELNKNIIDKIIDLVELIEEKGDSVSMKDVIQLKSTWKHQSKVSYKDLTHSDK